MGLIYALICGAFLSYSLHRKNFLIYYIVITASLSSIVRSFGSVNVGGNEYTAAGITSLLNCLYFLLALLLYFRQIQVRTHHLPIILFIIISLLASSFNGGTFIGSMEELVFYVSPLLLMYLVDIYTRNHYINESDLDLLFWTPAINVGLYLLLIPAGLVEITKNGPKGILDPRALSLFLLVVIAFGISVIKRSNQRSRRKKAKAAVLLSLFLIVFSFSRAALLIALLLCFGYFINPKKQLRIFFVGTAAIAIATLLLLSIPGIQERFFHQKPTSLNEAVEVFNTSGRNQLWPATIEGLSESPLFGSGGGSARKMLSGVTSKDVSAEHPHNEFLQISHDYGIVSASLFYLFYISIFARSFSRWRRQVTITNGASAIPMATTLLSFAVLLTSLVDNTFHYLFVMLPLAIMLGMSQNRQTNQ